MFPIRLPVLLCTFILANQAPAQIYADVQVAGGVSGTFTITLEHTKTPGAVANFIGLATGTRGWLDAVTGAIRYDHFYSGVTFHRVVAGFVSQTGSRNGMGTDGPGYKFRDEIDPTLTHVNYAVAMANSGKHTNGSQFYICKGPQSFLDGNYTVFGLVTSGQSVCDAINATPVSGSTPVTPITIQSVNIYGPSFAAYNREPDWLPKVRNANPVMKIAGPAFSLGYDRMPHSEYTVWHSAQLVTWAGFDSSYFAGTSPSTDVDVSSTATGSSHFYRMARVDYATARNAFIPVGVGGKTYTFSSNFIPSTATFNAAGNGGTWTLQTTPTAGSGSIAIVEYTQEAYLPSLYMKWNSTTNYGADLQFLYDLNFTSVNAGTFSGKSNATGYTGNNSINGTFTVTP